MKPCFLGKPPIFSFKKSFFRWPKSGVLSLQILLISNYLPKKVTFKKIGVVKFEIMVLAIYLHRAPCWQDILVMIIALFNKFVVNCGAYTWYHVKCRIENKSWKGQVWWPKGLASTQFTPLRVITVCQPLQSTVWDKIIRKFRE